MRTFTIALILALLAALPSVAQTETPKLISDHPVVKAAVEKYFAEQTATAASAKSTSARFAAISPVFGGGYSLLTPPVALRLNRSQFSEREVLQSSLFVLPEIKGGNLPAGPLYVSHVMLNVDTDQTRGGFVGPLAFYPGQTIPIQTYIFDGSEPSGLYAYIVMIFDQNGQLLAMPVSHFVFRAFYRSDNRGYMRVDGAEFTGSRYILLRGNFQVEAGSGQFAVIGNQTFPIVRSIVTEAVVDLRDQWVLPAGVYDVTLVVHRAGNTSYDSSTAPAVLKIFLPIAPTPTAPMPPFPGPPPGKG